MREIWTVFRFTLKEAVRKKAFIITTVLVLVLIVGACAAVRLFSGTDIGAGAEPGPDTDPGPMPTQKSETCYFIDEAGLLPGAREALAAVYGEIDFVEGRADELETYKQQVGEDKKTTILLVSEANGLPNITFYATDVMSGLPASDVMTVLQTVYTADRLTQAGVSEEVAGQALAALPYTQEIVGKMDLSGYVLGIVLTMIIFFAVYYYGYGVAMSVASEKTSRVMETLVVSAKPSRILLGKCLAMGVLGLLQLLAFLAVGAVSYAALVPPDFTIMGMPLALSSFTVSSALLVLLYFLLGYALYAVMNSVCGATVSRTEDLNSAMMPVMLVSLVSFYAAYVTMFMPSETAKRLTTWIPFTSPFVMPFRLLNEQVPASDIAISVVLLAAAIVLVAAVSVRLYSASVLHYGQRLKLRDIFKLKT